MKDPRSKTTATAENAMTAAERDAFLAEPLVTRLSTNRPDGWPHTTPTWFLWTGEFFVHSIGAGRRHLTNLHRDPRATECIDIDERLARALDARAAAAVCFGDAEIVSDVEEILRWNDLMLDKYIGAENAEPYRKRGAMEVAQGRRIVKLRPRRWLTWDFGKVDA